MGTHSSSNKLLTTHTFTPPNINTNNQQTPIKMDSAKAAVKDFMSKSGHHDTTVHEKVAPAVKHETIERQKHEEYVSAIDKEVHQDHYHTTEQPIVDKEVLPTQHHQNIIPVEHRSYEHGNNDEVEAGLAKERAGYRDTVEKVEGATTREIAPVVAGEHKHHHVHETIQPVIQKETIEPHVTHTTVPSTTPPLLFLLSPWRSSRSLAVPFPVARSALTASSASPSPLTPPPTAPAPSPLK